MEEETQTSETGGSQSMVASRFGSCVGGDRGLHGSTVTRLHEGGWIFAKKCDVVGGAKVMIAFFINKLRPLAGCRYPPLA